MLIAAEHARLEAEAKARNAEAEVRVHELLIEQMKYAIAKLEHERFGQSSERSAVPERLELRRRPARRPLPEHLPHVRIVYPSPSACPCCSGVLHKLGEDVTETLELVPRQWKVIQHVFAAERIHADDTTVPVMANSKTRIGRLWTLCARRPPVWRSRSAGRDLLPRPPSIPSSIWQVIPD